MSAQFNTATNFSGQQVIGAGALVTLISMVGGLGSLIRDLLLINRIGFGAELDGFYLVMMLPMLFVSVFTLPLGDTLASALGRIKSSRQAQRMLGATLSASLLLSGLIVALLLANAGTIFRGFVNGAGIDQVHLILPAALMLFLLSGLVVSGNSLMNHLCKPVLTASFQLIVPILSIVAILAAPIKWSILMAVAGMALGQLLNLVALYFVVKAEGYQLLPGSLNLNYFGT